MKNSQIQKLSKNLVLIQAVPYIASLVSKVIECNDELKYIDEIIIIAVLTANFVIATRIIYILRKLNWPVVKVILFCCMISIAIFIVIDVLGSIVLFLLKHVTFY